MELIKSELSLVNQAVEQDFQSQVELAEKEVAKLEKNYQNVIADASTKDGYKQCKALAKELGAISSGLEKARTSIKKPILDTGRLIDGSINPLTERVKTLAAPFKAEAKKVDDRIKREKEEREAKINLAFESFNQAIIDAAGKSSAEIEAIAESIAATSIDSETFGTRTDEAVKTLSETIGRLSTMAVDKKRVEEIEERTAELAKREAALAAREESTQQYMQKPPANDSKPEKVSPVTSFERMELKGNAETIESLTDLTQVFDKAQLEQILNDGTNRFPVEVILVRSLPHAKAA